MTNNSESPTSVTVAYLGPKGTFSQSAVINHFGEHCQTQECASIDEVFAAVEDNGVQFGVVPVENSTEGAINTTQDCLIDSSIKIVGEQIVPIAHNLLIKKGASGTKIETIASHEQSLAQCRKWLQMHYP